MEKLIIEIGTEEIPAGYIIPALEAFRENIIDVLDKSRIDHGSAQILGTPRRLVLMIKDVADSQNPVTSTITGPPEKIGFDENTQPTLAAQKFAEKAGDCCTLKIWDGFYHELHNEPEKAEVLKYIINWIDKSLEVIV